LLALLPDDSRAVQANLELKESFGADVLVIVMESRTSPVLKHVDLVEILAERLADCELVDDVDARFHDKIPTDLLLRFLPVLLDDQEFAELETRLEPEAMNRQLAIDRARLKAPMVPPLLKKLLVQDPLALLELLRARLLASRGGYTLNTASGYYVSKDDSTLLIFVTPQQPSDHIPYSKALMAQIEEIRDAAMAEYAEEQEVPLEKLKAELGFGITGQHAIAATETTVLQRDSVHAVIWSLVLVLLLFGITFRRLDSVFFVGVPLIAAILWTLGFTWLVVGHLNLVSTSFAAIVLGLGVDHAIHLYNRFLDHRGAGEDLQSCLEAAVGETGAGILIGAITTSGAFFALLLYDFRGLREFGFIVGCGVLLTLAAMLSILPALLAFSARFSTSFHSKVLMPFGTRALAASVARNPKPYFIASVLVTLVLGFAAPKVGWQGRVLNNDFSANPALQLREKLRSQFQSSPDVVRLILKSEDLDALEDTGRLAHDAFEDLSTQRGAGLDSIFSYVLPRSEQEERLAALAKLDSDQVLANFQASLGENGFRPRAFRQAESNLKAALELKEPLGLATLIEQSGQSPFLARHVSSEGDVHTLALTYSSGTTGFTAADIDEIEARLTAAVPGFGSAEAVNGVESFLAGGKVLGRELRLRMKEGYALVTAVALLLVLGVLSLSFRRIGRVGLALTPLLLGVLWMLGVMALTGIDMNVINVPVTAMILGIGIDDAVHVVHAFFGSAKRNLHVTYRSTGKALVLTTLTTSAGFGSLAFAGHPGLRSMGLLAILGCTSCLIASLTTLPSLMALFAGGHPGSPEDAADADEDSPSTQDDGAVD
ncbi:MAG: MMPL family transporter, partial [Acidobacteriota bacterium]